MTACGVYTTHRLGSAELVTQENRGLFQSLLHRGARHVSRKLEPNRWQLFISALTGPVSGLLYPTPMRLPLVPFAPPNGA